MNDPDPPRSSMESAASVASFTSILSSASYKTLFGMTGASTESLIREARDNLDLHQLELQGLVGALTCHGFLLSMLENAPTPLGQRHVACVIIQSDGNAEVLLKCAVDWYHFLFLPVGGSNRTTYKKNASNVSDVQTPTLNETKSEIISVPSRSRALRKELILRDDDRCVVTGRMNSQTRGSRVSKALGYPLDTCHIMPWSLNNFTGRTMEASAVTWDMLKSFAGIDVTKLAGKDINQAYNAFLADVHINSFFGSFALYFDATDTPHTYISRTVGPSEYSDKTVSFHDHSGQKGPIALPDPDLLAVHRALAKIVHTSGAADESNRLWEEHQEMGSLSPSGSTDIGALIAMNAARKVETR